MMTTSNNISTTFRRFVGIVMIAMVLYVPLMRHSLLDWRAIRGNDDPITTATTATTTTRHHNNDDDIDGELLPWKGLLSSHPTITHHNNGNNNYTTNNTDISFCFIVSIYGQWAANVDQLQRVDQLSWYNRSQFFAFTNLPNLRCKGWTRLLLPLTQYRRYITQSRYAKFFAWNDTRIQEAGCQVVFYMDAIGHIRNYYKNTNDTSTYDAFAQLAHTIYHSPQGHAQYKHRGGGGAFGEFRRIQVFSKDIPENIQASMDWMRAQPDFISPSQHNCTLYENRYMGYAVRSNTTLAWAASHCFWPRYSLELDSWRDQPLWCYCLDKYHFTPLPLTNHDDVWQLRPHRMGKKMKHQYHSEPVIGNTSTDINSTIHPNPKMTKARKKRHRP